MQAGSRLPQQEGGSGDPSGVRPAVVGDIHPRADAIRPYKWAVPVIMLAAAIDVL